ncbi:hypothetical protein FG167_02060 [Lacinutrix sp. WUR7]|uniref:hypothetical protein n=1 Tax=Lacinutrix sp. WUR7 TaxID=2653681 RepID=UPI00193D54BB|nr:hypothetical protein [Lacinutrix sp. WUR7]QRM88056.1 hypothetical protein FG167_02060 [Lacinutrix sp. WUR7]
MKISKIIKQIPYLIFVLFIISCASKKQVTAEDILVKEETKSIPKSKIIFLNYLLVKNAQGEKSITLINQIKTEGKLKGKPKNIANTSSGDLEYILLDKDYNSIEKHALKNPLKKTVEFVNDFGNFEKRTLDLDRVEFTIRIQLPPEAKHMKITELTNASSKEHIITKID